MQTFNTTHDYDRYWSNTGQFLQPCDRLAGAELEPFRQFGAQIYEDVSGEFQSALDIAAKDAAAAEEKVEDLEDNFRELKEALRQAVDESDADTIKHEINKILNA